MNTAERMRKKYNAFDDYDETASERGWKVPREVAIAMLEHGNLHADANILDVGCGTGLAGLELRRRGFTGNLAGLDAAEDRLAEAQKKTFLRKRAYNLTRRGDAYALPWKQPLYDGVVSAGMLGLVGPKALVEILRVLRTGYVTSIAFGYIIGNRTSLGHYVAIQRRLRSLEEKKKVAILEARSLGTGCDSSEYREEYYDLVVLRKLEQSR